MFKLGFNKFGAKKSVEVSVPMVATPYDRDTIIPLLIDGAAEKRLSRAIAWVIGSVVAILMLVTVFIRIFFYSRWWVVALVGVVALAGSAALGHWLGKRVAKQANAMRVKKYEKLNHHHTSNREDVAFAQEQLRLAEERLALTEKKLKKIIKSADNRPAAMAAVEAITAVVRYNMGMVGHRTKMLITRNVEDEPFN